MLHAGRQLIAPSAAGALLITLTAAAPANASAIYRAETGVEEESIAALSGPRTIPLRFAAAPDDADSWWATPIEIDLTGEIPHTPVSDSDWGLTPLEPEPSAEPGSAPLFPVEWRPLVEIGEPATLMMLAFGLLALLAKRRPHRSYQRYPRPPKKKAAPPELRGGAANHRQVAKSVGFRRS